MHRHNNVEVSQCVLFDREKTIGNCFQDKQNVFNDTDSDLKDITY